MAAFRNDTRGVGGQKQIMDLMLNHYSALANVKSTLNTRAAPRQHISQISPAKRPSTQSQAGLLQEQLYSAPKFAEQRETFKRVAALKGGYTDH